MLFVHSPLLCPSEHAHGRDSTTITTIVRRMLRGGALVCHSFIQIHMVIRSRASSRVPNGLSSADACIATYRDPKTLAATLRRKWGGSVSAPAGLTGCGAAASGSGSAECPLCRLVSTGLLVSSAKLVLSSSI